RGQRLEAPRDQQREAGEHSRRLWIHPDARVDGSVRGRSRQGTPRMTTQTYLARHAMGQSLQGEALVAKDGFSARYDLDRIKGVFSRPTHKLAGQAYAGKIL